MSIDFTAEVTTNFDVEAFRQAVEDRLADMVGQGSRNPIGVRFWKSWDDSGDNVDPISRDPDTWRLGHGEPGRWIVLDLGANVQVDISTAERQWGGVDEDGTTFSVTASYRTGSSVIVAAAAVIAGTKLGSGTFHSNVRQLADVDDLSPDTLLDRLRLGNPPEDLSEAARIILKDTPGFANWAGLGY